MRRARSSHAATTTTESTRKSSHNFQAASMGGDNGGAWEAEMAAAGGGDGTRAARGLPPEGNKPQKERTSARSQVSRRVVRPPPCSPAMGNAACLHGQPRIRESPRTWRSAAAAARTARSGGGAPPKKVLSCSASAEPFQPSWACTVVESSRDRARKRSSCDERDASEMGGVAPALAPT